MSIRLLFIDTETGSLDPFTGALLSVGLVDYAEGSILRTEEILIDPEGLDCEPKAMEVNQIDLDIHCGYSVTRAEAAERIREFCAPMGRPFVCGHNVAFDISFVRRLYTREALRKMWSHRTICTLQVLGYLGHVGLVPEGIGKLDQAIAHFGIQIEDGKRHTALADAIATAHLYTAMLRIAKESAA